MSSDEAKASELTRETTTAASTLTSSAVDSASTLERRAVELFTELDAEQRGESAVVQLPDTVLFDFDEHELKADAASVIADLAELAELTDGVPIEIVGHTDRRGSDDRNARLSQDRAQAVADALVSAGVDAGRITARGVGSTEPVATEGGPDDEAARAANRRVEVAFDGVDLTE